MVVMVFLAIVMTMTTVAPTATMVTMMITTMVIVVMMLLLVLMVAMMMAMKMIMTPWCHNHAAAVPAEASRGVQESVLRRAIRDSCEFAAAAVATAATTAVLVVVDLAPATFGLSGIGGFEFVMCSVTFHPGCKATTSIDGFLLTRLMDRRKYLPEKMENLQTE